MTDTIYTGELKRGTEPGTVVGEIRDAFGWAIYIRGTLREEGGGYTLVGTLGPTPESLKLPLVDDK